MNSLVIGDLPGSKTLDSEAMMTLQGGAAPALGAVGVGVLALGGLGIVAGAGYLIYRGVSDAIDKREAKINDAKDAFSQPGRNR